MTFVMGFLTHEEKPRTEARGHRGKACKWVTVTCKNKIAGFKIKKHYLSTNSDHAILSLFFFFCLEYIASMEQNTAVMQQNIVIEKTLKSMIIILIAEISTATKDIIQANKILPGTNME